MSGCAAAILAALLASPEPISQASHDKDACLQMGYITCTVVEECFEGYDGDRCFQQMQINGQCEVEDEHGSTGHGFEGREEGSPQG
jgi:hypothetical protein